MGAIDSDALKEYIKKTDLTAVERGALLQAISNMPTLTPPNEPLTLDELREMDGEPAYIPETNCWVLVTKNPFVPLFTWPDGEQCSAYDWYEQVGPVYRRPPEGEDGDANHA